MNREASRVPALSNHMRLGHLFPDNLSAFFVSIFFWIEIAKS